MQTRWSPVLFAAAWGLTACGGDAIQGETCAVGPQPCAEGLICSGGHCVSPDENGELTELDVQAVFEFAPPEARLRADGESELQMRFTLREKSGRPINQEVVLWTEPGEAASISPKRLVTEEGIGTVTLTSCDAARGPCSSSFVVRIALGSRPLAGIAQSPPIRVTGTSIATDAGVGPDTDGGSGGGNGQPPGNPLDCSGTSGRAALSAGGATFSPVFDTARVDVYGRTKAVVLENGDGWRLAMHFIAQDDQQTGTATFQLPSDSAYPAVGGLPPNTFTATTWPVACRQDSPGTWSGSIKVTLTPTHVKAVTDAACVYEGTRVIYKACGSVDL